MASLSKILKAIRAYHGSPHDFDKFDMSKIGTGEGAQAYGHVAQRLHQMNAKRVHEEGGWDPLQNPKPASFVEDLVGNQRPVTVDTHAFRLPGMLARDPRFLETGYKVDKDAVPRNIQREVESGQLSMDDARKQAALWQAQPKKNEYAAMERYYQDLGRELGLTPAQTQASAWVGGGDITGLSSAQDLPFLGFLEQRIMLTAKKLNMDPRDVRDGFIKGEVPLYAEGGPVQPQAPQSPLAQMAKAAA